MTCILSLLITLIPEMFIIYLFKFFYSVLILYIYIYIYFIYSLWGVSSNLNINVKVFYRNMESRLIVTVGSLVYNVVKQKENNILILSLIETIFAYKHIVLVIQWYTWYSKPHNCKCLLYVVYIK
jgi:hypothetical protein